MTEAAVVALLSSLGLTPILLVVLSRAGVIDHPNARSSHVRPTVRGGGIAVAAAALIAISTSSRVGGSVLHAFLLATGLFALLGLLDDLLSIPARARLVLQAVVAVASLGPLLSGMTGAAWWRVLFAVGVTIWLVGFVNVFNFMDGINGISVAQAFVAGATFAVIGHSRHLDALATAGVVVGAAAIGFLPFNFPRALLFLGDVGSYFLGACVGVLVVVGLRSGLPVEAVFGPVLIYLADTSLTLIRRIRRRAPWHEAHHEHIYQQLVDRGWSHVAVAGLIAALSTFCAALGSASLDQALPLRALANAFALGLVCCYLVLPTVIDHQRTATTGRQGTYQRSVPD